MDSSDYFYQSQYIWKTTKQDGLLPITNYTEEIKDQEKKKGGGGSLGQGKEIGIVTNFEQNDEECEEEEEKEDKSLVPGSYVYIGKRGKYGLIRNKTSESSLLLKVKK